MSETKTQEGGAVDRDARAVPGRVDQPKFTPGPWAWMGSNHGIYLATTHSGRRYVMSFRRMGMDGAQPAFSVGMRMVPASDLVMFEVGDGKAVGFTQGKADPSVYRYNVDGIAAPDAHLIAAAPELYDALASVVADINECERVNNLSPNPGKTDCWQSVTRALAALAKARGEA